eukprot:6231889-Amphidinium_carterae.1
MLKIQVLALGEANKLRNAPGTNSNSYNRNSACHGHWLIGISRLNKMWVHSASQGGGCMAAPK